MLVRLGLYALAALLLAPGTAAASPDEPESDLSPARPEVAPGIYLAAASEHSRPPGRSAPAMQRAGPAQLIVGGSRTRIGRWPWHASVGLRPALVPGSDDLERHLCGGALVAPDVVVTAAHCFFDTSGSGGFEWPQMYQVVTGRTRLSSGAGQAHDVADYFWLADEQGRPLYDHETIEWDVAFILLATPSRARTIRLAGPGEEPVWKAGREALITGWGTTEIRDEFTDREDPRSDALRVGRIRVLRDALCASPAAYGAGFFTEVMLCAGVPAGGVDACLGDSGGPLVAAIAGGGHRLVGGTSFGSGCGMPGRPGVYARLAADPIRAALREAIREIADVDVVGSGALPSNRFAIRRAGRDGPGPRGGGAGARLSVRVPGPGRVTLRRSKDLRQASVRARVAGRVHLPLRPRGSAARSLGRSGMRQVQIQARITYRPDGGKPLTRAIRVRVAVRGASEPQIAVRLR